MLNEDGCFTRVPNVLLDQAMAHMGNAELRVVLAVMRKTTGWQKQRDRISLTQFEELTGLARQHVIRGIRDAVGNSWVRQWKLGRITSYELSIEAGIEKLPMISDSEKTIGNETLPTSVTKSNYISNEKLPTSVTKSNYISNEKLPTSVTKSNTQKKGKKTTKERKEISSDASVEANQIPENTNVESITDAPAAETSTPTEPASKTKLSEHEEQRQKEIFYALAQICVLDTKLKGGAIKKAATQLRIAHAEASGADLVAFLDWWKTSDWRGQKGQPPTLHDVFDSWGKFRQGYATKIDPVKDTGYVDRLKHIYDEA